MTEKALAMRQRVQGVPVRVRMNPVMLSRAQEQARSEGVTLSEFMRGAVRRELTQ